MSLSTALQTDIIAGNQLWRIAGFFIVVVAALTIGKLTKFLLNSRAKAIHESRPIWANAYQGLASSATFLCFSLGLISATDFLLLGPADSFIHTSLRVLSTIAIATTAYCLTEAPSMLLRIRASQTEGKMDDMLVPILSNSLRATIVVLTVVQVAQILSGKEMSSIIAGLGISGLAVALAAQDTLKNFFGSITLLADKPFEIGDRVNVDGHDGPVEAVGLRSTRIRTLDGHIVTIPNGEMANKSIWNIAKRPYIRRIFNLHLTYSTAPDKVATAKAIVEDILKDHEGMDPEFPPRVYFNDFTNSALNLICIYWYHPPAYWDYLDFTEQVNTEILRRFNAAGIEFAFPTQTVHLTTEGPTTDTANLPA
ncbi:mechanosensitive ion channel family protein [Coraliomargarita akajimensis]|uniref:MscS Mechanosensitive ion channel n=1 Tax=Coraliomargarita akajimensis (strain DSM 45221 / IAM 15411 / JCM 23193 / KCTC 12865 / 04OKA010-24) TaxID=583355 RepID=D5EJL7_CORAD|nr:mechanosensitive ion channel family protein [Coraliomargarita akajimensis]ADE54616.1 MscS Mechanosensitive ion channel [Coraliomargarita akajimensis DSM 45221]